MAARTAAKKTKLEHLKVSDLDSLEGNPQRLEDGAKYALMRSIARDGFVEPILVRPRGDRYEVVSGNHRVEVALDLGIKEVPAVVATLNDEEVARLAVELNTVHGSVDAEALAAFLPAALIGEVFVGDELRTELEEFDASWAKDFGAEDDDKGWTDNRDEVDEFNDDPTTDDYYTPEWVFDALGLEYDMDVASPPEPLEWIPAKRRLTMEDDGLTTPWEGRVWMNPPYSKPGPWVEKFMAHGNGVALLPFSNSNWFRAVWARPDIPIAVSVHAAMRFVGGGIPLPTFFMALGDECIEALPNVGVVRRG